MSFDYHVLRLAAVHPSGEIVSRRGSLLAKGQKVLGRLTTTRIGSNFTSWFLCRSTTGEDTGYYYYVL